MAAHQARNDIPAPAAIVPVRPATSTAPAAAVTTSLLRRTFGRGNASRRTFGRGNASRRTSAGATHPGGRSGSSTHSQGQATATKWLAGPGGPAPPAS